MKRVLTLLISILAFTIAYGDDEDALRKLVDQYAASVKSLDMDLLKSIWIQSDEVTFIQPRGHQRGWEQIHKNFYLGAMANFSERDLQVKDLAIHRLDENSAWGEFYWEFNATFKKDGKEIKTQGRETQVWKKDKGTWQIVHVHYSGMPVTGEREGF